jgi:hypothetical protein
MSTRVIDTDAREEEERDEERWIDSESAAGDGRGGWDDDGDHDVIPPRPRGRLLRPLPMALIALIIAAAGFLGGIEAQKGSEGGSGAAAGPGGGGLPNFAALKEAAGGATAGSEGGAESAGGEGAAGGSESTAATGGAPSFGASSAAATGTVTSVEGHTIYVKESDGTTVAVKVGDGATVTRDSNVAAKKIHPGDTVTVEGSKHGSTVRASSVSATESGVEAESSVKSLFEE